MFIVKLCLVFWAITILLSISWGNMVIILRNKFWKDFFSKLKDAFLWLPFAIIKGIFLFIFVIICGIIKIPSKGDR